MLTVALSLACLQAASDDAAASAANVLPIEREAHEASRGAGPWPLTVAEASSFKRSSRLDEVEAFLDALDALPAADRFYREVFGRTTEGGDVIAVTASAGKDERGEPDRSGRANVIVNANIHGGEIEGKVAVQILLRELALGYHADLLEELCITFVPVFNVDGNDRIARTNRVSQNGPDGGVGERANGMGLDLNRDFVKLETPEVQALTWLVGRLDPIAFFDLHTTNGSSHGYDLTYSPSLSPNAAPQMDAYARGSFFPGIRARLAERAEVYVYDYGNFRYPPRDRGSRGQRGDPIAWATYDSRPRFGTNLVGLRDTLSILSEAYSYLPYDRRVDATYAFVLECLRTIARERGEIERRIADARASRVDASGDPTWMLGVDCELVPGESVPIRVGEVSTVEIDLEPREEGFQAGRRRVAAGPDAVRLVEMQARVAFAPTRNVEVGREFVVVAPSEVTLRALQIHLGRVPRVLKESRTLELRVFDVAEAKRNQRPFQGHREVSVEGAWRTATIDVPAGSLVVPCTPLTAHLLHPESDDSLTTWNYFDEALFPEGGGASEAQIVHPAAIAAVAIDEQSAGR
ncbi:MAG: M14 family metallopeptidase [Planctomycetota bacterium]